MLESCQVGFSGGRWWGLDWTEGSEGSITISSRVHCRGSVRIAKSKVEEGMYRESALRN